MDIRKIFQSLCKRNSNGTEDEARAIADEMIAHHQLPADEYIGSPDDHDIMFVHVPDWIERYLPGEENEMRRAGLRNFALDRFYSGDTPGLFVERLGISEETAERVIKILEKRGFKATS